MKVTINLISTRKYHVFVEPLLKSVSEYFLLRHSVHVNIFTDALDKEYSAEIPLYKSRRESPVSIQTHKIESYGFPSATLLRYRIMSSIEYDCDYIFYLDVDYLIVSEVDEEIFGPIVAVLHPGFSVVGGGSWCADENSLAYTNPANRKQYFCGGTQGGSKDHYVAVMNLLAERIDDDTRRGVKAEWNDEQHWNWYLSENGGYKILDSSYCMPDREELAKLWKIGHLPKRILALSKDHKEFQQP